MKHLNRAQILSASDLVFRDVLTPEWAPTTTDDGAGGTRPTTPEEIAECCVRIRNLTGDGRGAFIQSSLDMKAKTDNKERVNFEIEMLLIAMTAVGEDNKQLFTVDDVAALGTKNAQVIGRLAAVAQELSALDKASQDKAGKN